MTVISPCGKYRYRLHRKLQDVARYPCIFIMLNPSTADAQNDDPTIRRCISFAKKWGCSDLYVLNLFAVRATSPKDMKDADDPIGADNKQWVCDTVHEEVYRSFGEKDPLIVCAWGVHGEYMGQDEEMLGWLGSKALWALDITNRGFPKHPLYIKSATNLQPYYGRNGR